MTEQYTVPDNARCPDCGYPLSGLNSDENSTLNCPECNAACTPENMMPGSQRTRPLWSCGMIPGLGLLAMGGIAWGSCLGKPYNGLMLFVFFITYPVVLTSLAWICVSVFARVRHSDVGTRWRTFGASFLMMLAWVTPGTSVYVTAIQRAGEIVAGGI